MRGFLAALVSFLIASVAAGASFTIPSAVGPLTIDGTPDEAVWNRAAVLPGAPDRFGVTFPVGGETRVVVNSGYVCLSVRFPEQGRIVARSTGRNPDWWREDMVVWTIHFRSHATFFSVSVNPLGAYRVDTSPGGSKPGVVASATITEAGWSAEAAIPIRDIGAIGFLSVERIRAPRPDAPELRWHWPAANRPLEFALPYRDTGLRVPGVAAKDWISREPAGPVPTQSALAAIPANVWPIAKNDMWEKKLRAHVEEAAQSERRAWENVHNLNDWEKFRDERIEALRASLGTFPDRTPLRASVTRRIDYGDGFVVEDLLYESRPGLVVTANLYLPSQISGRIPGIIMVHSHHAPKTQWELQDMGMTWARAGAAVLIMDQLGAGERLQSQPWRRESYYSREALGKQLYLAGDSLMKWMVWDLMRGIDLLLERSYVDQERVILIGAVAGGGDPAAVTAALDRRVATVIPFNFGEASPEQHYLEGREYDRNTADPGWGDWETTRALRLSISRQFFPWFICASVAPRGFVFSFELEWPDGVEKEPIWARYKKVFELYGHQERLAEVDGFGPFTGPGEVTHIGVQHRRKLYPILNKWNNVPIPLEEYHNPRPEQDLMCLTADEAAHRKPKTANEIALRIAEERLSSARSKRNGLPARERGVELRKALKAKLGRDFEPPAQPEAHLLWTKNDLQFAIDGIEVGSEPGIQIPLVLIRPKAANSAARYPVVVGFSRQGKAGFLAKRASEIGLLLEKGIAVCLVDVRGVGETGRHGPHSADSASMAATSLMLGDTALGQRLKDARTVLRYLSARADVDSDRVILWGDSTASVNPRDLMLDQSARQLPGPQTIYPSEPLGGALAVLTALYEEDVRAVVSSRSLISYSSVLKDRFTYVPQDVIVPGILEVADSSDIIAALDPRSVRVESAVDGRNRPLTRAEMEAELDPVSTVTIAEQPGGPAMVDWIVAQCSK